MMYYGLVCLAVVMFGTQFFTTRGYQKEMGSSLFSTLFNTFMGGLIGFPLMLIINRFTFEYTHFTLLMALLKYIDGFLFSLCSLKALERVSLSVYSLFSMLGGMLLPLLAGVIFFDEIFTWGLGLCVVFVFAALLVTKSKNTGKKDETGKEEPKKKGAWIFYLGIFVFNGMSGVLSAIFQKSSYPKTSSAGFSMLCGLVSLAITLVILIFMWGNRPKISKKAVLFSSVGSPINRVANWLLLVALVYLPASVNYTLVTGGTIVVSTLFSYLTENKPKWKEWVGVVLSLIGIAFLVFLPF